MFKKILIPLDGSETGEAALPYAEELAGRLGAELVLYHFRRPGHPELPELDRLYLDRLSSAAAGSIGRWRAGAAVTAEISAGEPAGGICSLVENSKVDLVVMTAVSAAGIKIGKVLGALAIQLCQAVSIPVLLVKPRDIERSSRGESLINRVLITLDGSELSRLALPVGVELAARLNIGVTLFQMALMVRLYGAGASGYDYIDYTRLDQEERERAKSEMAGLEAELKQRGCDVTSVVTEGDDASAGILDAAKKTGANLLVMSTHGRSGLGRLVLGSVAEKVLRQAEMPLLLVRAPAG